MVKRSKKSKSKRVPLRQKHKIIRKVKEHHKKQAKEAKKQAKLGRRGKSKIEKDPGIPNAWPFREQELAALEARRARALEEIELKKAAKKERVRRRKLGLLDDEDAAELAGKAAESEKPEEQNIATMEEDGSDEEEDNDGDNSESEDQDEDENPKNGVAFSKTKKLKAKQANGTGKKKSAVAKPKSASDSKASDDYDFNTDFTD